MTARPTPAAHAAVVNGSSVLAASPAERSPAARSSAPRTSHRQDAELVADLQVVVLRDRGVGDLEPLAGPRAGAQTVSERVGGRSFSHRSERPATMARRDWSAAVLVSRDPLREMARKPRGYRASMPAPPASARPGCASALRRPAAGWSARIATISAARIALRVWVSSNAAADQDRGEQHQRRRRPPDDRARTRRRTAAPARTPGQLVEEHRADPHDLPPADDP